MGKPQCKCGPNKAQTGRCRAVVVCGVCHHQSASPRHHQSNNDAPFGERSRVASPDPPQPNPGPLSHPPIPTFSWRGICSHHPVARLHHHLAPPTLASRSSSCSVLCDVESRTAALPPATQQDHQKRQTPGDRPATSPRAPPRSIVWAARPPHHRSHMRLSCTLPISTRSDLKKQTRMVKLKSKSTVCQLCPTSKWSNTKSGQLKTTNFEPGNFSRWASSSSVLSARGTAYDPGSVRLMTSSSMASGHCGGVAGRAC